MGNDAKFEDLTGKTVVEIKGCEKESDEIVFICDDGTRYLMWHEEDCCESVNVEDVCGDPNDLLDSPILDAREDTNSESHPPGAKLDYEPESFTWTFYNIKTAKGHVTIRWLGESNGYYSESVSFCKQETENVQPAVDVSEPRPDDSGAGQSGAGSGCEGQ